MDAWHESSERVQKTNSHIFKFMFSSVLNEAIDNGVSTLDNLVFVAAAGNTNEDACKLVFFCFLVKNGGYCYFHFVLGC